MGYCAYLRKSRADEAREKLEGDYDALAHHRKMLEELSERMGYPIAKWYSDGIKSGEKIVDRHGMRSLLDDVRSGLWDGVFVVEVERLTRGNLIDQGTVMTAFADTETLIITPQKVYDPASEADMEYFEFGMFMSRREYKTINKRLVAGRVASVKDGQYIASSCPYGYRKVKVDGMKTLEPDGNAKYVRIIYEMFANGESYRDIANALDAMGAKPMRSAKWHPASVRNIVLKPVYHGMIQWNATKQEVYYENGRKRYRTVNNPDAILVDGLHEAIIDDELWARVRKRVDAAPVRGAYKTQNHYGRILKCAECGKALRIAHAYEENKQTMLTHLHPGEGCKTKGCTVAVLDEMVIGLLEDVIVDLEVEVGGNVDDCSVRIEECRREAERCRKAIGDNFDRMERGIITESDFVDRRRVLEEKAALSEAEAERLEAASEVATHERVVKLRDCIEALRDPDMPEEDKRKVIWACIDHMEYRNRAPAGENDIKLDVYFR